MLHQLIAYRVEFFVHFCNGFIRPHRTILESAGRGVVTVTQVCRHGTKVLMLLVDCSIEQLILLDQLLYLHRKLP